MTKTLTVEGDITAVDTATTLSTQGSVTAPSLVVPSGVSKIVKVIVGVSPDMAAAGRASFFIRLGGNAVLGGEQVLAIGAAGGQLPQAGADPSGIPPILTILEDLDIDVSPSETIRVQAEMAGQDLGTTRVVVTLVFG